MYFNIDQDIGTSITGWVVPDNPAAVPQILISAAGRESLELSANCSRPDIRDLGLHTTGMVGFSIDASVIPSLESLADLTIREAHSKVLIHRRHAGAPRKLFLLFASMTATMSVAMDTEAQRLFTLSYEGIERYPLDTRFAVISNPMEPSIFACGRLPVTQYHSTLQAKGYTRAALLRHPFEELGHRLEIAYEAARTSVPNADSYCVGFEPLIEVMETTHLGDLTGLQAAVQRLTPSQVAAITNPHIKMLACSEGEPPHRGHIAIALESLAAMDVVGGYHRFDSFRSSLSEILGFPVLESYQPGLSYAAKEIASTLARLEPIRKLLALDLALHSYVEDAFSAADVEMQRRSVAKTPE